MCLYTENKLLEVNKRHVLESSTHKMKGNKNNVRIDMKSCLALDDYRNTVINSC